MAERKLVVEQPAKPRTPKQTLLDKIEAAVISERTKWARDHAVEDVKKFVRETLDGQYEKVILTYLGIKRDWGEWRIDRINGRNSPIGDEMERHARKAAEELVREHILAKPVKLTAAQIKGLQKEYVDALLYRLSSAVREQAQADANTFAEGVLGTDVEFVTREEAMKAMGAINGS